MRMGCRWHNDERLRRPAHHRGIVSPLEGWGMYDPGMSGSSGAGPCCVWAGSAAVSVVLQ